MSLLDRFRLTRPAPPADALYRAVVAVARDPDWYRAGQVPDTTDGRFDMVVLVLALVLIRLETDPAAAQLSADVTERFIADMDGSLRQLGVGDQAVGKRVGEMVGMLGGRLGAYRDTRADTPAFAEALARNLWRGAPPAAAAVDWLAARAGRLSGTLAALPLDAVAAGRLGSLA